MQDPRLTPASDSSVGDDRVNLVEVAKALRRHWKLWLLGSLAAGIAALAITFAITPTFTARTSFLPPQQQQSTAASALASLGALSGLAGAAIGNVRAPADQYVALLQSVNVADRIVDRFQLMQVYGVKYRFEAREALARNVDVSIGKKDGLITVTVDDHDPRRAAEMANRFVDELRRLTAELALTEAQQRRVFFEKELKHTRDRLAEAQAALQASGFNESTLRAEPKAAAEGYARARAELAAATVRLQSLRRQLTDTAPEVRQQQVVVDSLRALVDKAERELPAESNADYIGKYREFKYQETLFELFAKQYETARLDESREGSLVQVIDEATVPEWKSKPKRGRIAIATTIATLLLLLMTVILRDVARQLSQGGNRAAS